MLPSACRLKVWHTTFNRENAGSIPAARTKDWACAGVGEPGQTVNLLACA